MEHGIAQLAEKLVDAYKSGNSTAELISTAERLDRQRLARRNSNSGTKISDAVPELLASFYGNGWHIQEARMKTDLKTAISVILYLRDAGVPLIKARGAVHRWPHILNFGPESFERRREYLGVSMELLGRMISRWPGVVMVSESNLESKREYFGLDAAGLVKLINRFPNIIGLSLENLEAKRAYLGFTKEDFVRLALRTPTAV